eukprot:364419-Chlamydomonas_euryale.AAC.5
MPAVMPQSRPVDVRTNAHATSVPCAPSPQCVHKCTCEQTMQPTQASDLIHVLRQHLLCNEESMPFDTYPDKSWHLVRVIHWSESSEITAGLFEIFRLPNQMVKIECHSTVQRPMPQHEHADGGRGCVQSAAACLLPQAHIPGSRHCHLCQVGRRRSTHSAPL